MTNSQIIGERINEWRKRQGWNVAKFGKMVGIQRTNAYAYFDGRRDPQRLFVRLRELGCDLNELVAGLDAGTEDSQEDETESLAMTGSTPVISKKQAEMVGFLEGIGITYEDLRRIYRPDLTIEEFLQHYQSITKKIKRKAEKQKKQPKGKVR